MENINDTNNFGFNFDNDQTELDNSQETQTETRKTKPSNNNANVSPQIPTDSAPFIVLCGPPSSGKSMVLKSLASYLCKNEKIGYSITANRTLLNTHKYQDDCDHFNQIVSEQNKRMKNTVDYLMADIIDKDGNIKAHFLEAPGEDFFSLNNFEQEPNVAFKGYLDKVAQVNPNEQRKVIYVILLDLDSPVSFRNDVNLRKKYEKKMIKLYNRFVEHHSSRVILLYNKVDLPWDGKWANLNGCTNLPAVFDDAKRNYSEIFRNFKRRFLFWDIENYSFLPYCTGSYPNDNNDDNYIASGPTYPADLWKEITKIW